MKKIMYIVSLFILTMGCKDKKDINNETTQLSDSLSLYFIKADDDALLRTERIALIQKAEALVLKQKQDSSSINNLFKVANQYYNIGEIEASKKITLIIAQKVYKINDSIAIAKAETYLGDCYRKQSSSDSAYLAYSKAERIYEKLKDKENIGQIHLNKAFLFYDEGDYLRSQISAFEALAYFRNNKNDKKRLYKIYNLVGTLFYETKNYEEATEFYLEALNSIKNDSIKNKHLFIAISLNNIGVAYQDQKKDKEALVYFQEALQNKELHKDRPSLYAMLFDNLAYSQLQLKEYSNLPDLFYKALHIRDSLQNIQGLIVNNRHLSEYYQDQKDTIKAIQHAQTAYSLATEKDIDPRNILLSLKQLKNVDPAKALFYSDEYTAISDSLIRTVPLLPDKMINAANEARDLAVQKAQLEKEKKNIIIWSISLVSLLIITLLINYLRTKKKESRLKIQETQQKANDEINTLLAEQQTKIEAGKQDEKGRIAKELHDGIINRLVGIRYNLHPLKNDPDKKTIQGCISHINDIRNVEKEIIAIAHDLDNFNFSEKNNFTTLLQDLIETQKVISATKYVLIMDPNIEWDIVNNDIKMNLYRIAQEAFQNIYKYAQAKNGTLSILKIDNYLRVRIMDNGIGFNTSKKRKGIGLKNMTARIEKLKGTFNIISSTHKGTSLYITIPLK